MDRPIPLFVELTAGLASVSLRLQGGPHCRPPVSRMGNKAGYAGAILEVLGLRSSQGAEAFLWCEPDDGCRALLQAYPQPDVLREAAEIIRSWADEDPRALWERLRAEGPIRGADGGEVARHCFLHMGSFQFKGPQAGIGSPEGHNRGGWGVPPIATTIPGRLDSLAASELARWARITTSNRLINLDPQTWRNTGQGGTTHGGEDFSTGAEDLALGFERVSARELARWEVRSTWSYEQGNVKTGFVGPGERRQDTSATATATATARHAHTSWPPVTVCADARDIDPGSFYVAPQSAGPDSVDRDPLHLVPICHDLRRLIRRSDVADCILGELRPGVAFSNLVRTVPNLVSDVLLLSAPCKVCGAVVRAGPVEMPDNSPSRSRAMECNANQGGDLASESPAASADDKVTIPVFVEASLQRAARVVGTDEAACGDLVFGSFRDLAPSHLLTSCTTIPYGGAGLPAGTVAYADPPYRNTTGYGNDLPREEVIRLAVRWSLAGATVCISEAEALPELTSIGWHQVEITDCRKGQKRTFSKQKREFLTLNREPAWVPKQSLPLGLSFAEPPKAAK